MSTESNPRYSDMSSKNSHEGIIWANPDPKMKGSFWRVVSQRVWLRWPSPLEGISITFKQYVVVVESPYLKTRGEKEQKWWKKGRKRAPSWKNRFSSPFHESRCNFCPWTSLKMIDSDLKSSRNALNLCPLKVIRDIPIWVPKIPMKV